MSSVIEPAETAEDRALRLLNRQMDELRDRVVLVEKAARLHASHLPTGDAEDYARYIRVLARRMVCAFEASVPVPYFGACLNWEDDNA